MAEEPDNLVLELLRGIRGTLNEHSTRFDDIETVVKEVQLDLKDVRLAVATLNLHFDALDERVEIIREGTVSTIGYAAHASREHVNLRKEIADLARRVEKLETRQ